MFDCPTMSIPAAFRCGGVYRYGDTFAFTVSCPPNMSPCWVVLLLQEQHGWQWISPHDQSAYQPIELSRGVNWRVEESPGNKQFVALFSRKPLFPKECLPPPGQAPKQTSTLLSRVDWSLLEQSRKYPWHVGSHITSPENSRQ